MAKQSPKMELIKRLSLLLALVLLGNLLTWFLFGRDQSIVLGSKSEKVLSYVQSPDTLIVFTGRLAFDKNHYSQVADFSNESVRVFRNQLQAKTDLTILTDERPVPIGSENGDELLMNNAMAYHVVVDRRFPFYSEVIRSLFAPGFVVTVESQNIWFFSWWEISDRMTGIS